MAINTIDVSRPGAAHVASYWAATAGAEVAGCDPVAGDFDADIAIIGGGYTGLSCAYHLAKNFGVGAHVLEAHRVAWGCSGRNGGFASLGIGKGDFGGWVDRVGFDRAKATFEVGREAVRSVAGILKDENIDADKSLDGGFALAHKPDRLAAMAADAEKMNRIFGTATRLLSRDELHRDYLASREGHGALKFEEGFALHPLKYGQGLARAALRHGAKLHNASPVVDWRKDGERHLLRTPGGTVRARQVVIATNGYTNDRLNPWTRGRLLPVLSNIIVTRPLSESELTATNWRTHQKIWDSRRLVFYYRLLPDNRIMFGARGGITDSPAEHRYRRAWLERRLGEMFPPIAGIGSEFFWYGWVCASYDKMPHVGTTDDPTVHYSLAYLGVGVALATEMGKRLAGRLGGDRSAWFGPVLESPLPRFPFPALRRLYQRIAYAGFALKDEWL
ncbi:MAG: NAD(P)/FAD-dependent oxidoreductase [Dongiaceae bacterium]